MQKFWWCALCIAVCRAFALQTSKPVIQRSALRLHAYEDQGDGSYGHTYQRNARDDMLPKTMPGRYRFLESSVVGLATGFCTFVARGMASTTDPELAELPPPYVPALFAVVLLVGVGLLTASLGDVLDEGKCYFEELVVARTFAISSGSHNITCTKLLLLLILFTL